jgi:hypothetical protein
MKKLISLLLIGAVLVSCLAMLTACGGETPAPPASPAPSEPAPAPAADKAP